MKVKQNSGKSQKFEYGNTCVTDDPDTTESNPLKVNNHSCRHCGETFDPGGSMMLHIESEHMENTLPLERICVICDLGSNQKMDHVKHLKIHHDSETLNCTLCGNILATLDHKQECSEILFHNKDSDMIDNCEDDPHQNVLTSGLVHSLDIENQLTISNPYKDGCGPFITEKKTWRCFGFVTFQFILKKFRKVVCLSDGTTWIIFAGRVRVRKYELDDQLSKNSSFGRENKIESRGSFFCPSLSWCWVIPPLGDCDCPWSWTLTEYWGQPHTPRQTSGGGEVISNYPSFLFHHGKQ